jgi:hypothetical protein
MALTGRLGEVRDGLPSDVAADEARARMAALHLLGEFGGQLARHRQVAGGGAVDDEDVGHGSSPLLVEREIGPWQCCA